MYGVCRVYGVCGVYGVCVVCMVCVCVWCVWLVQWQYFPCSHAHSAESVHCDLLQVHTLAGHSFI